MTPIVNTFKAHRKPLFLLLGIATVFTSPAIGRFAGLVFALTLGNPFQAKAKTISKKLLQYSVIGLGFGMNLHASLQSGKQGMEFTIISVTAIMIAGWFLGRYIRLTRGTSFLISAGTAICGGSAIAAVAPLTRSSEGEISTALGTIFILNAIALFIFPPIGHWLGMTQQQFGTWAAMAIHDTSSVVGAGQAYGTEALQVATTVKLTRALWIIPLAFVTTFIFNDKGGKINIPWFILFFILAMIANTFLPLPTWMTSGIVWLSKKALIITLFLIGAGLSMDVIKTTGVKPMILGIMLWLFIAGVSLAFIML